jgi:hypothetical protein
MHHKELGILKFRVDSKQENLILCETSIADSTKVGDKFLPKLDG